MHLVLVDGVQDQALGGEGLAHLLVDLVGFLVRVDLVDDLLLLVLLRLIEVHDALHLLPVVGQLLLRQARPGGE